MKLTSAESYALRCLIAKLQKSEPKPKKATPAATKKKNAPTGTKPKIKKLA